MLKSEDIEDKMSYFVLNSLTISVLCLIGISSGQEDPTKICCLPKKTGPCRMYIPSYYHDASSGKCLKFGFGGCHGNANRFFSEKQCNETCIVSQNQGRSNICSKETFKYSPNSQNSGNNFQKQKNGDYKGRSVLVTVLGRDGSPIRQVRIPHSMFIYKMKQRRDDWEDHD